MNSQKIPYNYMENKILSFKEGTDYRFMGEEYNIPDRSNKRHTQRNYQILSPQLRKEVQNYLSQQNAILMSFDFKGPAYTSEWTRPDNGGKNWEEKVHISTKDENGNSLNYAWNRENVFELHVIYPGKPRENFNQRYQVAKQAWEAKGSPIQNIPPSGVKCWSCYEVISDTDIVAGRYWVENTRLDYPESGELSFLKTFEHVKEHGCQAKEYDPALRNNYQYWSGWINEWLKTHPQKKHEINCQDCLNRLWNEVNGNLFYLETWAPEQTHEIGLTKQVLTEIKARLDKLTATGQFHNCGIKKCCETHDKPDHSKTKNRDLITAAPVEAREEKFQEPKGPTLDRQTLLNWMKEKGIVEISLDPANPEQLLIKYTNNKINSLEIANDLPQEWGQIIKQEVSLSPIKLNSQNSPNGTENKNNLGRTIAGFSLLAVGLAVGVIAGILIYRHRPTKKE